MLHAKMAESQGNLITRKLITQGKLIPIESNFEDYELGHKLPQFPVIFANPKDKMGLKEHVCHPLLALPDDKIYVHATLGSLSKGYYFSEPYTFTVTDCITLTQIFPSGHIFSTC